MIFQNFSHIQHIILMIVFSRSSLIFLLILNSNHIFQGATIVSHINALLNIQIFHQRSLHSFQLKSLQNIGLTRVSVLLFQIKSAISQRLMKVQKIQNVPVFGTNQININLVINNLYKLWNIFFFFVLDFHCRIHFVCDRFNAIFFTKTSQNKKIEN